MNKSTVGRAAGFLTAVGVTGALLAAGVNMTGAYFQDQESGRVSASTGEVDVAVDANTPLSSSFGPLMPGEAGDSNTYSFINRGTGPVDYYLGSAGWSIADAAPQGRASQAPGSSISDGVITLDATGGGTSYEWDGITTLVANGSTISFEWRDQDGTNDCGGGAPRMFVQGGAYNTWDSNIGSCGTAGSDGWNTITRTVSGVVPGPAGNVAVVNDSGSKAIMQFRNVTVDGTSLTTTTTPTNLCSHSGAANFEVRVQGPGHDTNWQQLCNLSTGDQPILVAEDVPVNASRSVTVSLRLNGAAGNDLANKAGTAQLVVVATQPNKTVTDQPDQAGNDA